MRLWFLLAPSLTALFLSVGAVALVRGAWQHRHLDAIVVLLLVPAGLAVVAAPGYVYAVFSRSARPSLAMQRWVKASLLLAILAAGGSFITSIPTGVGPVLSFWTLVMAVKLYRQWNRQTLAFDARES